MKRFGQRLIVASCFLALHAPVHAQEEPRQLAERIYELSRAEENAEAAMEAFNRSFQETMTHTIKQQNPNASDQAVDELYSIINDESAVSMEEMKGPMRALMIDFYVENFTSDELASLVGMHASDVYQKQLSLLPGVMEDMAVLSTEQMGSLQRRLGGRINDWLERNK